MNSLSSYTYSCEGKIITTITYGKGGDGGEDYVAMGERLSWMVLRAISGYAVDAIPFRKSLFLMNQTSSKLCRISAVSTTVGTRYQLFARS